MIAGIHGTLEARGPDWVHVRVGGFSLQVYVPTSALGDLGAPGQEVHLHTHLVLREDGAALYGFPTPEGLRLFKLLITVDGVGPRHALGLLSAMPPAELAGAIVGGNEAALGRVPGVGKKTASRLVLELKGRLQKEWGEAAAAAAPGAARPEDTEVMAALGALGYSSSEAREAVARLPRDPSLPFEERLRLALQELGG